MSEFEVAPEVALQCLLPADDAERAPVPKALHGALDLLTRSRALCTVLSFRDWRDLLAVSYSLNRYLQFSPFWPWLFNHIVVRPDRLPAGFSVFRLVARVLYPNSPALNRPLLHGATAPTPTRPSAPTPVVVCLTRQDSIELRTALVRRALSTSNAPTATQHEAVIVAVDALLQFGVPAEQVVDLAASVESPNRTLQVCIAAYLAMRPGGPPANLHTLVRTATTFIDFVGLCAGVGVDGLRESKWDLRGTRWPQAVRRMIIKSLASMSWWQLLDLCTQGRQGLMKALFKSLHFVTLLRPSDDAGHRRLYLLQSIVRGARYPTCPDAFAAWHNTIVTPLIDLVQAHQGRIEVPAEWIADHFNAALAGRPLVRPLKRSIDMLLARYGNTSATWALIMDSPALFASWGDLAGNLVSIICADCPIASVQRLGHALLAKGAAVTALAVYRAALRVQAAMDNEFMSKVSDAIAASPDGDSVQVTVENLVKDRKGNWTSLDKTINVARTFGADTVAAYLTWLSDVTDGLLSRSTPVPGASSIIVCSSELTNNPVRTGAPPAIPSYSPVALWRNETVSLARSGVGDTILAGITWCQPEGSTVPVDLDLSAIFFQESFACLGSCSFQTPSFLAEHSGDIRSAPFPNGSMEYVTIGIERLRQAGCRYVALTVHSFTGQSMDTLADASVFVANPARSGTGPNGLSILTAARLTGKGTCNVAAFLTIGADGAASFTCVDHTLNVDARTARSSSNRAGDAVSRCLRGPSAIGALRSVQVAALYSAQLCERVHVVGRNGAAADLVRASSESSGAWLARIVAAVDDAGVLSDVAPANMAGAPSRARLVFVDELVPIRDVVRSTWRSCADTLAVVIVVRLQSHETGLEEYAGGADGHGPRTFVCKGWDTLRLLRQALSLDGTANRQ
ncbi:Uncharacterized protein PBTT_01067 [Plasmodiophora brassicae]|uniref:Uncharacterized protein n=1 Tax=Plasmodiophora brassicae TaxID=37360 RepID=A0A0G4IZE8_PLABS|nr:hypothetical protein PBRA_001724 [Plasmodiophora brassicae]SPQ93844.1 unnamed protein product [Plasmodiophora brassicae]